MDEGAVSKRAHISWDEALDTIAAKLNEIKETRGPEYVALARRKVGVNLEVRGADGSAFKEKSPVALDRFAEE